MLKDKILSAIKTALGKTTSINGRTLHAYVAVIADRITDETKIGEAIKPYVEVLREFQGNINSVAAAASAKQTELKAARPSVSSAKQTELKAARPPAPKAGGENSPDCEEPEWFRAFCEQQEKRLSAIKARWREGSPRKKGFRDSRFKRKTF